MDRLQDKIGMWAEATFNHTTGGIVAHLQEEVGELHGECSQPVSEIALLRVQEEAADCAILLMALAHHLKFSLSDAVKAKHSVNVGREWGPPDANGVTRHV